MARTQKRARHERATLVFLDESGFLLNPLVRRTLAPRGETPVFRVAGRTRQRVSVLAALTLSPVRNRLRLLFRTLQDSFFNADHIASFLRDLLYHIPGRIILVWDGWTVHGAALKRVQCSRLEAVTLPPYTPELNPVEQLWCRLKWADLANESFPNSATLLSRLTPLLAATATSEDRLRGFWSAAGLPLHGEKLQT